MSSADFATSATYQGFILTIPIVLWLFVDAVITAICYWSAMGPYSYGGDKKVVSGTRAPMYGDYHFHFRWLLAPGWAPPWAWYLALLIVSGAGGVGMGLFFWITNSFVATDVWGMYWITIGAFFLALPVIAACWAMTFFYGRSIIAAAVIGFVYFAAAGVLFGMTVAYPFLYPQIVPNLTYQWLAFGLGAAVQVPWTFYIFVIICIIAYKNSHREMHVHLAEGESMEERNAAQELAGLQEKTQMIGASSTANSAVMAPLNAVAIGHGSNGGGGKSKSRSYTVQ